MSGKFLPYGRQSIDDDDIAAVTEVLRGDFLTTGPACPEFEKALCASTGANDAVVCSSGTSALHLALLGLGIGAGDIVIVPSVTFLATANAARYVGADVVFADVDPLSGVMTPETFRDAIKRAAGFSGRVRTVVPVHLGGQCADMPALSKLAKEHDILVVEDACHAMGSMAYGETLGACTFSHAACFSFHPVKTIAMGEGGAVLTNDQEMARHMHVVRSHAMITDAQRFSNQELAYGESGQVNPWYYEAQDLGFNYRASDIHCALGQSQLRKLPGFVQRRSDLINRYDRLLEDLNPVVQRVRCQHDQKPAWHLCQVLIDFKALGKTRRDVMLGLRELGIGTQVHYIPVHRQPYFAALYGDILLPQADAFYERTLSLPLYPELADEDVDRVVAALRTVLHMGDGRA